MASAAHASSLSYLEEAKDALHTASASPSRSENMYIHDTEPGRMHVPRSLGSKTGFFSQRYSVSSIFIYLLFSNRCARGALLP